MAKMKEVMGPRTMSQEVEKGGHLAHGEHGEQKRGHTRGKNLGDSGPVKSPKQMCGGGKAMKKMAKGGTASARADGIASKGKTKGKWC